MKTLSHPLPRFKGEQLYRIGRHLEVSQRSQKAFSGDIGIKINHNPPIITPGAA
jgi:hypothetical protein